MLMHRLKTSIGPRATFITLCVTFAIVGCEAAGPERMGEVYDHHDAGAYTSCCNLASNIADSTTGVAGDEAAYMAGSCCAKVDRPADAERHLLRATRSSDARLAGQAMAELGLLYLRAGQDGRAADMLEASAERLTGQDRANAYFYAGVARQQLSQHDQARVNFALARGGSNDRSFNTRVDTHMRRGGFTLQVGAFKDVANARRAATDIAGRAAALKIGPPVLTRSSDGRLTRVQVGRFSTLSQAQAAKQRLGQKDAVVVRVGQ